MEGRTPPHSLDAEKSVLGAAMLSKEALYEVLETKGRYLPASLFNAGTLPCITPFINSLSSINVQFYIAVQSLNVRKQKEFQKMNQRVNIGEGY